MTDRSSIPESCRRARETNHAILDGDLLDASEVQAFDAHVGTCAGCRERVAEHRKIQETLRHLPRVTLPQETLDRVWVRTSRRAGGSGAYRKVGGLDWRLAAAAAVLTLGFLGLLDRTTPPTSDGVAVGPAAPAERAISQAELDEAAEATRLILKLTARAIGRSTSAAIDDVLNDEVSTALRRVPIRWPDVDSAERRKTGNGA